MVIESCNVKQEIRELDDLLQTSFVKIMQVEAKHCVENVVEPVNVVLFGKRRILQETDIGATGSGSVLGVTK